MTNHRCLADYLKAIGRQFLIHGPTGLGQAKRFIHVYSFMHEYMFPPDTLGLLAMASCSHSIAPDYNFHYPTSCLPVASQGLPIDAGRQLAGIQAVPTTSFDCQCLFGRQPMTGRKLLLLQSVPTTGAQAGSGGVCSTCHLLTAILLVKPCRENSSAYWFSSHRSSRPSNTDFRAPGFALPALSLPAARAYTSQYSLGGTHSVRSWQEHTTSTLPVLHQHSIFHEHGRLYTA